MGCCCHDNPEGIERLLDSCWKNVDLCFMVYGPFRNYKQEKFFPNKSIDIIKKYPNAIYLPTLNLLEHEKRQIYLDCCKEYGVDWLIITDDDEYFHDCQWEEFAKERERVCSSDYLYNIKNYSIVAGLLLGLDQPRLIKNPSKLQYIEGHHYMLAEKGTDEAIIAKDTLYSIKLCHDPSIRSPERMEKHDQYIKWLRRYETTKMLYETPKEKENRERCVYAGA